MPQLLDGVNTYIPRTQTVRAVQLCWRNWGRVCDFLNGVGATFTGDTIGYATQDTCGETAGPWIELAITTADNKQYRAEHGEFIVIDSENKLTIWSKVDFHRMFTVPVIATESPRVIEPAPVVDNAYHDDYVPRSAINTAINDSTTRW